MNTNATDPHAATGATSAPPRQGDASDRDPFYAHLARTTTREGLVDLRARAPRTAATVELLQARMDAERGAAPSRADRGAAG